jgi:hypothetical protein
MIIVTLDMKEKANTLFCGYNEVLAGIFWINEKLRFFTLTVIWKQLALSKITEICLEVRGVEGRGDGKQGEEMAQTMYAHMNKWIKKKIKAYK